MNAVATAVRRRWWRAQQSAWLLLPLLGLAWVGFGYLGVRGRRRGWVAASLAHLTAAAAAVTALVAGGWWTVPGVLLAGGAWGTGVLHALVENPRWLRVRAAQAPLPAAPWLAPLDRSAADRAAAWAPDAAEPGRQAAQRQLRLEEVVEVARSAGAALPPDALALVLQVQDAVAPVLARVRSGRDGPVGAETRYELESIVEEHLPDALERYLSLPAGYVPSAVAPGARPEAALLDQLRSLVALARQVQERMHDDDARELRVQAAFLDAKLHRSDLVL